MNHSEAAGENSYKKICGINELKEGSGKRFIVDDTEVAVFKVGGEIFALSNICPHQHTSLIYDGFIEDSCVVCPAHGWKFDLRTGRKSDGYKGLDSFPLKIIDNQIYVKVVKKELNW